MAKKVTQSWGSEAPPARPACRRCGVELYLVKSIESRACGDCRDHYGRLAEQAKRVNCGKEGSLPAALARGFQVRTGARVGDE